MRVLLLLARALVVVAVLFGATVGYAFARLRGGRGTPRDALRGAALARALERLGATFVKLGQIMATRPDVVPEEIARALAQLQDNVAPAPLPEIERVLAEELSPEARARFRTFDQVPVAAASVAQVHRAVLDDGSIVAVKIQRLRAHMQIDRDLALFAAGAWLLDRLPRMRWVSLPGAVERFGAALRAQLDFTLEASNNRRLARNFQGDPRIRVPRLHDALCSRRVLTMEFVDGVRPTDVVEGRAEIAQAGLRCIAQMVFLDGFVHADMHPGNLMFTRDGHVYLIDLGLVAEIPEPMRKPWVETFLAVATCDGKRAAELFYVYAPVVETTDYPTYEAEVVAHLEKLRGRPLAELEVTTAVGGTMAILRRHRVQVDPTFTVVQLAMLVAEGVGKQLDPQVDVYATVAPFLAEAAIRWANGARPRRAVPLRP